MAAREGFASFGGDVFVAKTHLQRLIQRVCTPDLEPSSGSRFEIPNLEPDLTKSLEILDILKEEDKKFTAPREAALTIVHFVNNRNPNVSMLALGLLDICVKNCGYPFHLQIASKEFLNELVRRFPERPPLRPSRVHRKILSLLEEWRRTICETSIRKQDLGHIRDMHRLLQNKQYIFPELRSENAGVLNQTEVLRSAEEMKAEEDEAYSARLQELIRRETPQDLQEANRLMKIMAGYDIRNKTDWRAKAAEEVSMVQQKAKLLEEMLQQHENGEAWQQGDAFEDLANALKSAHPKIQKMCEEEHEDHETVAKLLEINDSIHRTFERYGLMKKGDVAAATKIPKGTLGTSGAGVSKDVNNQFSLIDLDDPEPQLASTTALPQPKISSVESDLMGLSIGNNNSAQLPGSTAFQNSAFPSSSTTSSSSSQPGQLSNAQITGLFSQQPLNTPPIPQTIHQPYLPSPFLPSIQSKPLFSAKESDPFAQLAAISPQPSSSTLPPLLSPQSTIALASKPPQAPYITNISSQTTTNSSHDSSQDDEWNFASSLPPPESGVLTLHKSHIEITWRIDRPYSDLLISSRITSCATSPITDVKFEVAAAKAYNLSLQPQSSSNLLPNDNYGIRQSMVVKNVVKGQSGAVRMRWKVQYVLGRKVVHESGSVEGLPLGI